MTTPLIPFRITPGFAFVVQEHESVLLFRHGKYVATLAPGRHRRWRRGYHALPVDLREQTLLVTGQEMLSADQVVLKISALTTFRIVDALALHRTTGDLDGTLHAEVQLALRQTVAAVTAEEFLQHKAGHGPALLARISPRATTLGLQIDRVEIRDVMLPADLKRSFMSALQQRQAAQVELDKARTETAALRTLANAAKLMRDNPELLPLRYLQTLQEIGSNPMNTLVLGLTDSDKLIATAKR
jgi:regulator of protease activity HflC (stomatin/prohibitin superfamily)